MNIRKLCMLAMMPVLGISAANAQTVDFFKTYTGGSPNAAARSVTGTKDGNVVFTGAISIPNTTGDIDMLLVKTKPDGDTLWIKQIGTTAAIDYAYNVTELNDGSLLIAGLVNPYAPGIPTSATLIKTDAGGVVGWQKTYPMPGAGTDFVDLRVLNDGYVICGGITDTATNNTDAWLVKTNLNGDKLWDRSYGGAKYDDSWQIEKTPDGGFLLGGGSFSYATGTRQDDAWLVKTDGNGVQQWIKHYGNADTVDWIWSMAVANTPGITPGYVFVGVKNFDQNNFTSDMFLAKVDTAGNVLWDKSLHSAGGNFIQGFAIEAIADGGFYIAGIERDMTLGFQLIGIKIDANGNVVNKVRHGSGGAFTPRSVYINTSGGAYIAGQESFPQQQPKPFLSLVRNINAGTDVNEITTTQPEPVSIYPNPAKNDCIVTSITAPIQRIMIRDITGRILRDIPCNGSFSEKVSLDGIPKGNVLVHVLTGHPGTSGEELAPVVLKLTIVD